MNFWLEQSNISESISIISHIVSDIYSYRASLPFSEALEEEIKDALFCAYSYSKIEYFDVREDLVSGCIENLLNSIDRKMYNYASCIKAISKLKRSLVASYNQGSTSETLRVCECIFDHMATVSINHPNDLRNSLKYTSIINERRGGIVMKKAAEIFIVHGTDKENIRYEISSYIKDLGVNTTILSDKPNRGMAIMEKIDSHASSTDYCVVIMTADDSCLKADGSNIMRSRQNVMIELGYFMGSLGRSNVICIVCDDVEIPSDIHGIVYISYKDNWKNSLFVELKAVGITS